MALDLSQYNQEVVSWADRITQVMQSTASSLGIQHRAGSPSPGASVSKISSRAYYDHGMVNRVGIRLPRTLIYPHKGAGKGMGGSKGSTWLDSYGQRKTTNPQSMGKMGTGNRREKPFLNVAMQSPDGIEKLGDIAAQALGDVVANNLLIK